MKTYSIVNHGENLYVEINSADAFVRNGPYKNEESAKRRIRDLKRKDAINAVRDLPAADIDAMIDNGSIAEPVTEVRDAGEMIVDGDIGGTLRTADAANDPQAITDADRHSEMSRDDREASWDGLDCSCGGGWRVGHAAGCPEAMPRGVAAFRRYCEPFIPFPLIKPSNGYRPAHRASRLRSARR